MSHSRDLLLSLAALVVILAFTVGITNLPGWLEDLGTSADTATSAPVETGVITPTLETDSADTPDLRVAPNKLVFHGERKSPWEETVYYSDAILLTVAEAEDKTITLLHPPVYSEDLSGQANLIVTPVTCKKGQNQVFTYSTPSVTRIPPPTPTATGTVTITQAAEAIAIPAPPVEPKCFNVSIDTAKSLTPPLRLPGTYTSTLYVGAEGDAEPVEVGVEVRVRYTLLWPILMVAFGVLATEFLVWWGKRWGHYGWANRRAVWMDLLSEKFEWTTLFQSESESEAAYQVRVVLRKHLGSLSKRLGKMRPAAAAQIPAELGAARETIFAFRQAVVGYLKQPWCNLDHLEDALARLKRMALQTGKGQVDTASSQIKQLGKDWENLIAASSNYGRLDDLWKKTPPGKPDHQTLANAWKVIGSILDQVKELQQFTLPQSPTSLSEVADAAAKLGGHLVSVRAAVVKAAEEQIGIVKEIKPPLPAGPNKQAQALTLAVLGDFAKLAHPETPLIKAEKAVADAKQPLKDKDVVAEFNQYLKQNGALTLAALGEQVAAVSHKELQAQAIQTIMFRPVRHNLQQADEQMSQPQADMQQVWEQLSLTYSKDRRFVTVGRRLKKLEKYDQVKDYAKRAYLLLLAGDALGAKVELERAEYQIRKPEKEISVRQRVGTGLLRSWHTWVPIGMILVAIVIESITYDSQSVSLLQSFEPESRISAPALVTGILIGTGLVILLARLLNRWRRDPIPGHNLWGDIVILWDELWENLWPLLKMAFLKISSQTLTTAIAVAVILEANKLANTVDTWGSPFDFVAAFTWGIVANRAVGPIQSTMERVQNLLKGETEQEQPAAESAEKGSAEENGSS
ncbi:MAG: hypothetical protein SWK90_10860 [Chloroflexota bacterium]|nr:hypothetical protein [Chloroflexota bacterium]